MKYKKNYYGEEVDIEEETSGAKLIENGKHRRPIKNWKKAWTDHEVDYDEIDDFYK